MKTAVEWLEEQVIKFHNWKLNPVFDENCFDEIELRKAIQKAKEMEKEQKIQAFEDGEHNYFYSKKTGEEFESGIEYYNEKFKQQEQ